MKIKLIFLGLFALGNYSGKGQIVISQIADSIFYQNTIDSRGFILSKEKENKINYIQSTVLKDIVRIDSSEFIDFQVFSSEFALNEKLKTPPIWTRVKENNVHDLISKYDEYLMRISILEIKSIGIKLRIDIGRVNKTNFKNGIFLMASERRVDILYSFNESGKLEYNSLVYIHPR